jgi:hypothetical protein
MPRGDKTGPVGMGSMTGQGLGFCTGFKMPGYRNSNMGLRRGYRHMICFGRMLTVCAYLAYRWRNRCRLSK